MCPPRREELDVALGGGHTEITQGLDRPILIGQMLGEVAPTRLVRKTRIATGDLILLTHGVAIEGTAILARERSERLRGRVDADLLAREVAECVTREPVDRAGRRYVLSHDRVALRGEVHARCAEHVGEHNEAV